MTDPVGVLTAVSVTNGSAINSITSAMSSKLTSSGNITAVQVTLTTDTDAGTTMTVQGVAVTSGETFTHNFRTVPTIAITVKNGSTTNNYTLTVYDELQETNVSNIMNLGWWPARHVSGDLDTYTAGGLAIDLGLFYPKFVVNIMITDGFTGYFDVNTKKLKVYKGQTEATKAELAAAKYDMILME